MDWTGLRGILYESCLRRCYYGAAQERVNRVQVASVKSDNQIIKDNYALLRCLITRGRDLQKQLSVDGYGADVQLRNYFSTSMHPPRSFLCAHADYRKRNFSLYMTEINLASERLRTATSSSDNSTLAR
jgi:hypothetical protein